MGNIAANMNAKPGLTNKGVIVAVRGSVVDVRFDEKLPSIYSVLRAGAEMEIVIEVLAQCDAHHVRGIALTPTQGLARGIAFRPTADLVMRTRSGDFDPGLVNYLARTEQMTAAQSQRTVNQESGLLGVSEISSDMRDLLAHEAKDVRAAEAVALFCYQAKKWIGAFAAALGWLDSLVFNGGIGGKRTARPPGNLRRTRISRPSPTRRTS